MHRASRVVHSHDIIPMKHGHRSKAQCRPGATLLEFAVVVPLLFLCFFAAFEFCRVAMIQHTADNAVYEGCRKSHHSRRHKQRGILRDTQDPENDRCH